MPLRLSYYLILAFFIVAEMCFNLYFRKGILPQAANATGLFTVSLITGLLVIGGFFKKHVTKEPVDAPLIKWPRPAYLGIWIAALAVIGVLLNRLWSNVPISIQFSDIIPLIETFVKRLFTDEYTYKPVTTWGYTLYPNYLPMHWMPYSIAEYYGFDYRWIGFAVNWLAGAWIICRSAAPGNRNAKLAWFIPFLLVLNWFMIFRNNDGILAFTIEIMVAGYYMLLIGGLGSRNAVITGLTIATCLMSRYILVLWLPLWVVAEWISGDRRKLIISMAVIFVFVLIIYIVPFLSHDWGIFKRGYDYYTESAVGEWNHLNERQQPAHLYDGAGFAWLFYEMPGNLIDRIKLLQRTHMLACLGSVFIMGIWYWFNRHRIHLKIFLLGSFKIYLAVFLSLIQVPYTYLMITGTFVSIAIFAEILRYRTVAAVQTIDQVADAQH